MGSELLLDNYEENNKLNIGNFHVVSQDPEKEWYAGSHKAWKKLINELFPQNINGTIFTVKKESGEEYKIFQHRYTLSEEEKNYAIGFWGFENSNDTYYTPNIFKNRIKTRTEKNLSIINTWAIDIDCYKLNDILSPINFFHGYVEELIGSVIPEPSYIEFGHGLRLIYVLEKPLHLIKKHKTTTGDRSIVKAYKSMTAKITEMLSSGILNIYPDRVNCNFIDIHPMNSLYRRPGSINEKTGIKVGLYAYSDVRYTLQEVMDEYLPTLPKWYTDRDVVAVKKNKKMVKLHSPYQLWEDRLDKFREIARTEKNINRENLCHLYLNGLLQTGFEGDLMEEVLEFNNTLIDPVPEKELKSKISSQIKSRKKYKYPDKTINEKIGKQIFTEKINKREKDRLKKEKAGKLRCQIAERHYREVIQGRKDGLTASKIAEKTGLKEQSVKNLIGKAKKEGLLP